MAPTPDGRSGKSRSMRKGKRSKCPCPMRFEIPYFAHQQLNPKKYHPSVGLPVGRPGWAPAPQEIATVTNGGWEDAGADISEEDAMPESDHEIKSSQGAKRRKSTSELRNPYKRLKVAGGRPAIAKKVTADLDSDDELIVRMKNAKYLEKHIADRLKAEGRTNYNPKTIGTRWARLRRALEKRNDDLLDAELTDWHDGDDDVLQEAVLKAEELVNKAKAEAEGRKWRIVADLMKNMKPVVNFSQNACRDRYASLQAGTAKPTPESIVDPDDEVKARIKSRCEKEKRIIDDKETFFVDSESARNIEGNGWTSKQRKYV